MTRRKTSPSSLLLFVAFLYTILSSSNSASLTSLPPWTSIHQLQSRSPEFNVGATDDGVPTLESGEKPAKDPQIIIGPLPVETPDTIKTPNPTGDSFDDGEIIDSTPIPSSEGIQNDSNPHPKNDDEIYLEPEPSEDEEQTSKNPDAISEDTEGPVTPTNLPKPSKATQYSKTTKSSKKSKSTKKAKPSKNPKYAKKPRVSKEPVGNGDQEDEGFGGSSSGDADADEHPNVESSPEVEGDNGMDSDLLPEPSALPDYTSSSKPSSSPSSWPSAKPSNKDKPSQSDSMKPSPVAATGGMPIATGKPNSAEPAMPSPTASDVISVPEPSASYEATVDVYDDGYITQEESDVVPEPSSLKIDSPPTSLPPTETAQVPSPSNTLTPTAIIPPPAKGPGKKSDSPSPLVQSTSPGSNESKAGSNNSTPKPADSASGSLTVDTEEETPSLTEEPSANASPGLSETNATPSPSHLPLKPASPSVGDSDSTEKVGDGFVSPNGTYTCVNFAGRSFDNYQIFDENAMDGSYTIYKGSGVALNPSLPMPYRYHVYGENWTYHLNVMTNSSQNIILGFAEVFPKACASGRNGSFRVFTVSVGEHFEIIDIMESSGCGMVLQTAFENVKPMDQVIDLSFNALSGKAMVSVACFGDTDATNTEVNYPKADTSVGQDNPQTSDEASKKSYEQCFHFSEENVAGFTSPTELGKDVDVYTDVLASVSGSPYSEIYKSHILGSQFMLILDVGSVAAKTVELGFAEIYEPGCKEGFRVFTVESGAEFRTVDVFEEVGCKAVLTLQLPKIAPNPSGKIAIDFKSISNFAMVSSVCVIADEELSTGSSPPMTLVVTSGEHNTSEPLPQEGEENTKHNISVDQTPVPYDESSVEQSTEPKSDEYPGTGPPLSVNQTPLPSDTSFVEQSTEPELDEDPDSGSLQGSPLPKENGVIVAPPADEGTTQGMPSGSPVPKENGDDREETLPQVDDENKKHNISVNQTPLPSDESHLEQSTEPEPDEGPGTGPPQGSPYPKENGLIDASITVSPTPTESPTNFAVPTLAASDPGGANDEEAPQPTDELLPSDFSQTTLGEDPNAQPTPSWDPANTSSGSPSQPGLSGATGNDSVSSTPTPSASLNSTASPVPSSKDDETTAIVPTRTPIPTFSPNPSTDGGNESVTDKQGDVTIESPSPSPSILTVEVEAPSPSASGLNVTIEAPSPSSSPDSASIIGTEPAISASGAPTPTIISAAAFSPAPSAATSPSPSGESSGGSSSVTPQPLATDEEPDTTPTETASPQSASPVGTPNTEDEVLPPVDATPTESEVPQPSSVSTPSTAVPSSSDGMPEETAILPPANSSPLPQDGTNDSGPAGSASPPPAATISQNQIVVIPSASAPPIPTETPTPPAATVSPSPPPTQVADPSTTASGIGPPGGVVSGSVAPDSTAPSGSPIPDVVANNTTAPESSPQATPSPSRANSSVGSGQVIVDSPISGPSPEPAASTSAGTPDEGPVEVTDNTTEIIQVTGDTGTDEDNQPSILVGEYKDLIATTPVGSGFAIGMGILGSLLVILLLVCLFFAIFRGGGAAYSYSSGYSSRKPTDDPSQGRYTDDQGLGPTGYGNEPSYGQNTQDRYGTNPVTFETRAEDQSEPLGFEMPAAGGFGAHEDATRGNEEPDTMAEYSSLNLQPSRYDSPRPETTAYRESRQAVHADKTRINDSYGSNPGDYTFTGTFTMPDTGYSQRQITREHEDYRDSGPARTEQDFRGTPATQDSFNDYHSTARPTMMSESSGKQGRVSEGLSTPGVIEESATTAGARTELPLVREEGIFVDDIRSSLLDSEQAASSYALSMGSNPPTAQSPYEAQLNTNMAESESGNVVQRDVRSSAYSEALHVSQTNWQKTRQIANQDTELSAPLFDKNQNEPITGASHSTQTKEVNRSVLPSSSSNDEPWPWWWSGENTEQQHKAAHITYQMGDGKENSPLSSNGMANTEQYRRLRIEDHQKKGAKANTAMPATAKGAEIETNLRFVPDSSWRRQYSSTSDEAEDDTSSNPYFDELRRRREPYVRSVANRLSTGPGSFSVSAFGESDAEEAKRQFAAKNKDVDVLRSAREVSSWITRDPVEV